MKLKIYIKGLIESKDGIVYFRSQTFKISLFVAAIFISLSLISGLPPSLHTIQGYAFQNGGSQAPIGTQVRINSTQFTINTQTSGPPGNTGFYSAIINASDGENITITAFNITAYGRDTTALLNSPLTTKLNITMNNTRPAETDVNITTSNNSVYDKFKVFNITFNVRAIGGMNSINCNATIAITNENIINVTGNKTKNIGNINLGDTNSSFIEVRALNEGATTLNITSFCSSDGENFEGLNKETITIRVANQPPQLHTVQGYIFNIDNITQVASGTNVTINTTETGSIVSLLTSGPPGHTGFFSTTINALDGELIIIRAYNATHEGFVNITLVNAPGITRINASLSGYIINAPSIIGINVDDEFSTPGNEIDLIVAGAKIVNCTANVSDPDGFSDILNVTAVFFDSNNASSNSQDDNNNHYTNNSCSLSNCALTSCEVDCIFNAQYYANANASQSWLCNMTATDLNNNKVYSTDNISINSLLGVEFPDSINYGTIGPGKVSNESVNNVTNRGNVEIDIKLDGYGGYDGDESAMNCSYGKNISIENEKYNLTASNNGILDLLEFTLFYKSLTDSTVNETGFNLDYRKNDAENEANKPTYWRIYIPPELNLPVNASCSGKVNIGAMVGI